METILLATDFSPAANNAMNYGADLAAFLGTRIVLVHAFSLPVGGYDTMAPVGIINDLQQHAINALKEVKEKLIMRIGYDPGIDCKAEPGSAFAVISDVLNRTAAELVVMGMVGQAGAIRKQLIGSSSLSAARNLSTPLFIIPEGCTYKKISKVSFACDLDHIEDGTVLHTARSVCSLFNASLELVNVRTAENPHAETKTMNFVERTLRDQQHSYTTVFGEEPSLALEKYFEQQPTDLVMLYPREMNFFKRLFQPTVSRNLVLYSRRPVICIH